MSEQSLPIDALVYRLGESAADLLHRRESPEAWSALQRAVQLYDDWRTGLGHLSHRPWLLVDLVPDDWNRGARDHPYHETIAAVHLI